VVHQYSKPQQYSEYIPLNYIGNELTKKGIQAIYVSIANQLSHFLFFSLFCLLFSFFCFFIQHNFFLVFFSLLENEMKIAIIERNRIANYQLTAEYTHTHTHTTQMRENRSKCLISSIPQQTNIPKPP